MSRPIIEATGLAKRYDLGELGATSLREELGRRWRRFRSNAAEPDAREFWALRDVSFSVQPGEVVGIIGRNGAGKSTLLKVLSRITEPTAGRAVLRGRVASLLEVGTGFHPDLSGRDNIYLNGAILGMARAEIRAKFDAIVAFAEVEKFIDTPVKRYSSGMYVRLAFAVAAHLEPDILIVDEVLAVGDAAFQNKCIGTLENVASRGRTVLFVSHNMALVTQLCRRGILLEGGRVAADGPSADVVRRYVGAGEVAAAEIHFRPEDHEASWGGHDRIELKSVRLVGGTFPTFTVHWHEPLRLELDFEVRQRTENFFFGLAVSSLHDAPIFGSHHNDDGSPLLSLSPGRYRLPLTIENPLRAGRYHLSLGASTAVGKVPIFRIANALRFEVLDIGLHQEPYPQYDGGPVNGAARWGPIVPLAVSTPAP